VRTNHYLADTERDPSAFGRRQVPLREILPFSPLAGEMPKAEGGFPAWWPYLVVASQPPLCHSVTSPPARGGEGNRRLCIGLCKGERKRPIGSLPYSVIPALDAGISLSGA